MKFSQLFPLAFMVVCCLHNTSLHADLSDFGPFPVGTATVTVTRPNSSTFTALLFYPATAAGANTPLETSSGPYSAITFGHGFLQVPSRYSRTLSHLASYGHIVIASNSETGLFPNHTNFANDMRFTLNYLEARNANPADPFFGKVDIAKFGLFGHSMGGGAGLLASAADNRIKAVAGLASAITNPSPVPLMPSIRVPKALLSGDKDGIVNYTTNTLPLYNAGAAPKLFPLIDGGFHVGFQDEPYPIFPDSGSLARETQLAITRVYLTSFFGLYLRDEQSYWRNVWGPEASTVSNLTTQSVTGIGFVLNTPSPQSGQTGTTVTYEVTVTNQGPQANQFALFVEDNVWSVDFSELQTPVLQPNQTHSFTVHVNVPQEAGSGQVDAALLSVRSEADQGTRAFVTLNTQAVASPKVVGSQLYHSNFTVNGGQNWEKLDTTKSMIRLSEVPQTVGLESISTSVDGINGLVIDCINLSQLSEIELRFQQSPQGAFSEVENPISAWEDAPSPTSIALHPGQGQDGSNRVLIQWSDGSIANRYLLVQVLHENVVIAELLIGHLLGEQSGPSDGIFTLTFSDLSQVRANIGQSASAGTPFDIDKNGTVAFADISAARVNVGTQLTQITF